MSVRSVRLESGYLVAAGVWLLLAGCGGGEFGSELKVRPNPRPLRGDDQTVRLPQDERFSITLAPSEESPGLQGTAEADSQAAPEGSAAAAARVESGGSALAGFQLGHGFENDSERQADLHVRIRCEYETKVEATPPGPLPGAKVSLRLYARDGRNRLLRDFNLAQHSTEFGAASSTGRPEIGFVLTLGPHERVSIFLAGSVKVDTQGGHSAGGSLKLSGLEMEVRVELAPPVQKAGDGQG